MATQFFIETDTDTYGDCYAQSAGNMVLLLSMMREYGMLTDAEPLRPVCLTVDDFDGPPSAGKVKPEKAEVFAVARKAAQDRLDRDDPATTGIPRYKAAYHDGFLITPVEIAAALLAYESRPADRRGQLERSFPEWGRWIAFLRKAATAGIRVL
ncbi:hypothetical protein OG196_14135 [Kitasatospora purpeofusca]|uniref:hypothetical protein n=1 Tax=Kitasatospora purpeofusca TaxID=67352 RepID=UPI002E12EF2A|nr:hypothetical protein OG196_14135 [Kitasatospora purpeofusca]